MNNKTNACIRSTVEAPPRVGFLFFSKHYFHPPFHLAQVSWRLACGHHSSPLSGRAMAAADQSSVVRRKLMDSYSGYLHTLRPVTQQLVRSPCNSSLVSSFSASTFSILSGSLQKHDLQWAGTRGRWCHTRLRPSQVSVYTDPLGEHPVVAQGGNVPVAQNRICVIHSHGRLVDI